MERVEIREFDAARYLDSDKMIAEYLAVSLEDPRACRQKVQII